MEQLNYELTTEDCTVNTMPNIQTIEWQKIKIITCQDACVYCKATRTQDFSRPVEALKAVTEPPEERQGKSALWSRSSLGTDKSGHADSDQSTHTR